MSKPHKLQTRVDLMIRPDIKPKENKENARPGNFIQRIIAASYKSTES